MSSNIKFDKETLIKHRFWIALGVFVPLWLVVWLVLWLSVSSAVEETKKSYGESMKSIDTVKNPPTEKYFFPPMKEKTGVLAGRKNTVWGEVWSKVSDIPSDWPYDDQAKELAGLANVPFGTAITGENETRARQEYRDVIYKGYRDHIRDQFHDIAGPITMDFDHVIALPPISETEKHLPSYEELWLTQETVWVKRELLWVIRQTINNLGWFQPVPPSDKEEPLPEGVIARHRYRNSNWELELLLKRGDNNKLLVSKASTLKNINKSKRTLPLRDIKIWLTQTSASDEKNLIQGPAFTVQGDPVPWNQKVAISDKDDVRVDNFNFTVPTEKQPILATQIFNWGTSPIKQIDEMILGYQSSRTAFQDLKPFKEEEQPADKTAQAPATGGVGGAGGAGGGAGGAPGGMMGGPGAMGGMQGMAGGMAGGAGRSNSALGINTHRYLQVTKQVRRIPIGIVLVLDQAYIDDLMAQFANSRLRFQPTQVQWQQDTRGLREGEPIKRGEAAGGGGVKMMGGPMMGGMMGGPMGGMMGGGGGQNMANMMQQQQQRMQGMMMGGAQPGLMPGNLPAGVPGGAGGGGPQANAPATAEESDPNLVEFALYGIISLYDHYAPAAETPAPGGQAAPGQATPPAPGSGPATPPAVKPGEQPKTNEQPKANAAPAAPKAEDKKNDKPATGPAPKADAKKDS